MKFVILLVFFQMFCVFSYGQKNKKQKEDIIDIQCKACLDSEQNQTTAGMIDCEIKAQAKWDKELNKYYKLLMKTVSPQAKEKLKLAQKDWIAYRDQEIGFSGQMYTDMQGTMYQVIDAGRNTEIIKKRALELKEYYEILIEQ